MSVPVKITAILMAFASFASGAVVTYQWDSALGTIIGGSYDPGGFRATSGCSAGVAFTATGTQASLSMYRFVTGVTYSLDGAAAVALPADSTNLSDPGPRSIVWGGGSDSTHTIVVYGANYISYAAYQITGTAPSMTPHPVLSNQIFFGSAAWHGSFGGAPTADSLCGTTDTRIWGKAGAYGQMGGEASIAFRSNPTAISLLNYHSTAQNWAVYQDGSLLTITGEFGNGGTLVDTLVTGLSGTHNYELRNISLAAQTIVYGILLPGATFNSAVPYKADVAYVGDSIVEEKGAAAVSDARLGYSYAVSRSLNLGTRRHGVYGCQVKDCISAGEMSNAFTGASPAFPIIILEAGVNDASASRTIGDCSTTSTFTYEYKTALTTLAGYMAANGTIYAQGILPNNASSTANVANYRTAQQTALACYNSTKTNGVTAIYVPTDTWIIGTSGSPDLKDSVHPNATGYAKINKQWMQILAGKLYGCSAHAGGMIQGCNSVF